MSDLIELCIELQNEAMTEGEWNSVEVLKKGIERLTAEILKEQQETLAAKGLEAVIEEWHQGYDCLWAKNKRLTEALEASRCCRRTLDEEHAGYRADIERLTEELGKLRNDYDYAVTAWNKEIDRNALADTEDTK